jgi:hypothetical protein
MNNTSERAGSDLIKGVVAVGVLTSFLMEQFQALWNRIAAQVKEPNNKSSSRQEEPATVKAANALALRTRGRGLSKANQPIAAEAVHYAVGRCIGCDLRRSRRDSSNR